MENKESIYDLALHEALDLKLKAGLVRILRVPGGWIYNFGASDSVFVTYSDEFEPQTKRRARVVIDKYLSE